MTGRQHGNDYNTSWIGNQLVANPSAAGFKNSLNGTTGDIHIHWIGKYRLSDFKVFHSTFLAEYPANGPILTPYTQPKYDGWQNQNANFLSLGNTRRVGYAANMLRVGKDGSVAICVTGSRIMTTSDAFMKMVKPPAGAGAANFVRVYTPNLTDVTYSSLITSSPTFSTNIEIYAVLPEKDGVLAVGTSGAIGLIPQKAPAGMNWSFTPNSSPSNPTAFFGRLTFDSTSFSVAQDTIEYPPIPVTASANLIRSEEPVLFPNPANDKLTVVAANLESILIFNSLGKRMLSVQNSSQISIGHFPAGLYLVQICNRKGELFTKRLVKN
jgi:hypothetical protein